MITTHKKVNLISKQYDIVIISVLLIATVVFSFLASKQTNNSFSGSVKQLKLPKIPELITEYMESQSSDSYNAFDWFSFYSPELGRKVSVKYSGQVGWHQSPLLNRSINYKFNKETLRLKSFSSESVPSNSFDNPFHTVFSEYATYNVARKFTKKSPKSDIVYINDDESDIMIQWKDNWLNIIRELDAVEFLKLAQAVLYSESKEMYYRYFSEYWKERKNDIGQELKESFMDLLYTPLYYINKEINENIETGFNEEDYNRILALASIFGSKHMEIHNFLYQPNVESNIIIDWSPFVYDFMGMFTAEGRQLSPFINFNYVYEFFLRNPRYYYGYLKELHNLNNNVLGNRELSSFYDKFSCENVSKYPNFEKTLSLGTATEYAYPSDINGFCLAVDKIKNYEIIRYLYLNEQLNNSTMHWGIYQTKEDKKETYLAIWNPSPIPVKLNKITCGISNCTKKWKLTNKPGWEFNSEIISPQMIRIEGGYNNAGIPTSVVPQPYIYIYKWDGENTKAISELSFEVVNAVTGKDIFAVRDFYPMIKTEVIEDSSIPPYFHKLRLNILNFKDSPFVLQKAQDDWKFEIKSSKCRLVSESFLEYVFDCSEIDSSKWPYLLDYSSSLIYKGVKIRETKGEFYQDYNLVIEGEKINQENFKKYKSGTVNSLIGSGNYQEIISKISNPINKEEFKRAVARQKDVYLIPANTHLSITSDLDFPESVIFIENGAKIKMNPLAQIKAGVLIVSGKEKGVVTITNQSNLPPWYGIKISSDGAGYFSNALIANTANLENGAINGENIAFLMIANTKFEGNSSGIKCSNCVLDVTKNSFTSDRWFRVDAWALNLSNSLVKVNDMRCLNHTNCILSYDDKMSLENIHAENIKSSVLKIEGASSVVDLKNIFVNNAPSVITKQFFPVINYEKGDDHLNVNYTKIIDLDDPAIYKDLQEGSPEKFYKKYNKILEKEPNDSSKFILKRNLPIIKEDIIIPEKVSLEILPGTNIILGNKTSIIAYGQLTADGEKDNKIIFSSGDRKERPWGAILLRGEKSIGKFNNCIFENGGGDYLVGMKYTGSLTAHEAKALTVTNSTFNKNKNDDAINCKYSTCVISGNTFKENDFDAIDFDFAEPQSYISKNIFINNGDDAIDLSSSNTRIYENSINLSGDKGISVGEFSNPLIFNNLLKNNNIGIESKDSSKVVAINNTFIDNKVHLNAYQKKKRFGGGGEIDVYNSIFKGVESQELFADYYSKININREPNNVVYGRLFDFYDINKIMYGISHNKPQL